MLNFKSFTKDQIILLTKSYNDIFKRNKYNVYSYVPHTIVYVSGAGIEWMLSEFVNTSDEHIITFYKYANLNNFLNVSIHLEEYLEVV